ncbi:hypothetical protein D3C86_2058140 [compost metagenome]
MRGFVSIYVLAEQFHISRGTVSNIWKGIPNAGKAIYNPRSAGSPTRVSLPEAHSYQAAL